MTYFRATVGSIGAEAGDLADGGVLILFGSPCPQALAEVSVVLDGWHADSERGPAPGDTIDVGRNVFRVREVGELAGQNLRELGHAVLYLNPEPGFAVLPGATIVDGSFAMPTLGEPVWFR